MYGIMANGLRELRVVDSTLGSTINVALLIYQFRPVSKRIIKQTLREFAFEPTNNGA
jgi:hypothetical protein